MDESDVLKKSISKIQTSLFLLIKSFSLQHQEIESDKKMITDMKQIFGRELNDSCIISAIHVLSISDLLDVLNQHKNTDKLEKFNNKLAFLKPFF